MTTESGNRLSDKKKRPAEAQHPKVKGAELYPRDNRFLDAIFDNVGDEIMIVDPEFNIRDANRAFLTRYNMKKADVLGRKCFNIREDSDGPCSLRGKRCPLEQARKTITQVGLTHTHNHPGEVAREFMLTMVPVISGNEIDSFIEIAREVTDYKGLVNRLQASEQRFRGILDTATNAILSIDEEHKIILFNNAAQRIFGYTRDEILGKNLNMIIPERYGDHEKFVRRFLEKGDSEVMGKTLSLTAIRRDGMEFPIELSLSFTELEGKTTFTAIIRDVSEKRLLEKKLLQSERLAAVGQAVASVAHEIKNPLMIIGGFSNQMKKSLSEKKNLHKLDMILEEVMRLERLVAGLGDFTKTYTLVNRMTDINAVIRDVIKIMAEVYPPDVYGFNEFLSMDIGEINCDPDKLKQVFINVISNGFEAMSKGGTITISTERISDGAEIRISDQGVGIPEEGLQRIFEPFYTTREGGSGLGLSISYKIIRAHQGDISAVSKPGEGTTFIIHLPSR